jgi:hypothetical protein
MSRPFFSWRTWLTAAILADVLLGGSVGCTPTHPGTKVPDNGGEKEQLPTPPKRDPG